MENEVTLELADGARLIAPAAALAAAYCEKLRRDSGAATVKERMRDLVIERPHIGGPGLHGVYAGVARGEKTDHILEVLDEAPEALSWEAATKWAASIGGTLPTRREQALLFGNVPELFKQEAYWSCEAYASDAGSAWSQDFFYGYQYYGLHEDGDLRARAVRRLSL